MKNIITHNGRFHADEIFAVATLELVFKTDGIKVVRTRDPEIIKSADIVLDVGRIYDVSKNLFDHHQPEGAGQRENGIPYATFGLVWKHFSDSMVSPEEAGIVDEILVQVIDANDNGISLFTPIFQNISGYSISSLFASFYPTVLEKTIDEDVMFFEAVAVAKKIVLRELAKAKEIIYSRKIFTEAYKNSEDKKLLILNEDIAWERDSDKYPELLFVVKPKKDSWNVHAVRKGNGSFENRKDLPKKWAGLENGELQEITGVPDAIFCHRNLFMAVASSKEGAVDLAKLALES